MSLKKVIQKLNLESEEAFIDSEVTTPDIIDQLEAEEAEAELVEAVADASEAEEAMDESDEVEAEVDEQIAEAKATIAEAEGKIEEAKEIIEDAEKDGIEVDSVADENGEIPAEEVVAAQEALQNLIKRTGYKLDKVETVTLSREDIRTNTLEAYKVNLEGWEEMKAKVKAGAQYIWDKIVAAYKWIMDKIKAVLPTRINKIYSLIKALAPYKSASVQTPSNIAEKFSEAQLSLFTVYGAKLQTVGKTTKASIKIINDAANLLADAVKAGTTAFNAKGTEANAKLVGKIDPSLEGKLVKLGELCASLTSTWDSAGVSKIVSNGVNVDAKVKAILAKKEIPIPVYTPLSITVKSFSLKTFSVTEEEKFDVKPTTPVLDPQSAYSNLMEVANSIKVADSTMSNVKSKIDQAAEVGKKIANAAELGKAASFVINKFAASAAKSINSSIQTSVNTASEVIIKYAKETLAAAKASANPAKTKEAN